MLGYLRRKRDVGFFHSLAGLMQSCRFSCFLLMHCGDRKQLLKPPKSAEVLCSLIYHPSPTSCVQFSKLLGVIKRKECRFTSLLPPFQSDLLTVIGSAYVSLCVWCCFCDSACDSVLDLNAFERQIKAESLGVGAEDNSGTSLTSSAALNNKWIHRKRLSFLFIDIDLTVLCFCTFHLSFSGDRVMADEQLTCDLFRFLQLLCEGHNSG